MNPQQDNKTDGLVPANTNPAGATPAPGSPPTPGVGRTIPVTVAPTPAAPAPATPASPAAPAPLAPQPPPVAPLPQIPVAPVPVSAAPPVTPVAAAPPAAIPAAPLAPAAAKPAAEHKLHLPGRPKEGWRSIISTVLLFILAPVIALGIAAFVLQSYQVDGQSMETTLQNNDRLIVDKVPRTVARITHHDYIPKRGNIIIFNQSGLPDSGPSGEKQLIKRVIGLPGEKVVISNGSITIFNKTNPKGFNPDTTTGYIITAITTPGDLTVTLGPNQIFVCGDNRTNSEDSRFFGPVDASQIVGKLVLRLLPANNIKKF